MNKRIHNYSDYELDPIEELSELVDYDDDIYEFFPDDLIDAYEKIDFQELSEMKVSFLLDRISEWGFDPFGIDGVSNSWNTDFYSTRLLLIADAIEEIILNGEVADSFLLKRTYAYRALIYSMFGQRNGAKRNALKYASLDYNDYEKVCRFYANIRSFDLDLANSIIASCIDAIQKDRKIDEYSKKYLLKKYCYICHDQKGFQQYSSELSELIKEKLGFSFVEFD